MQGCWARRQAQAAGSKASPAPAVQMVPLRADLRCRSPAGGCSPVELPKRWVALNQETEHGIRWLRISSMQSGECRNTSPCQKANVPGTTVSVHEQPIGYSIWMQLENKCPEAITHQPIA